MAREGWRGRGQTETGEGEAREYRYDGTETGDARANFVCRYPMTTKAHAGEYLDSFANDFGIPKHLVFYGER